MGRVNSAIIDLGGKDQLVNALTNSLAWIKKSINNNPHHLSSAHRTIWNSWSHAYIETSGYIIPTLIKASKLLGEPQLLELSSTLSNSLIHFQNSDGSFYQSVKNKTPYVFDTAQVLLGLLAFHKETGEHLEKIKRCYNWIIGQIDEGGQFKSYNYKKDYNPSYYSRVLWPLALYEKKFLTKISPQVEKLERYLLGLENENSSFKQWSFDGRETAFSHTIIYTLRGLYEYALLKDNKHLIKQMSSISSSILSFNNRPSFILNGEYNQSWAFQSKYICSAGSAQFGVVLLKMLKGGHIELDHKFIVRLIEPLLKNQKQYKFGTKGGVSSSIPSWGPYQRFKETNWTQKFFADVIIELLNQHPE